MKRKECKKWTKKFLSMLLAVAMVLTNFMQFSIKGEAAETVPSMIITEDAFSGKAHNGTQFETYYWTDGIDYYYKDQPVEFISETQIQVGEEVKDLKNKKTEIGINAGEEGSYSITLSNLSVPIGQIAGLWNASFGGTNEVVYQTDIPKLQEIRAKLGEPVVVSGMEPGEYHLTEGTIFEKANEWSPGIDFGDGNGTVKEGYFGTLPDIVLTVGSQEETDQAVEAVIATINALPLTEDITLEDKSEVEDARALYDSLTEEQKSGVDNYDFLVEAETKLSELEQGGSQEPDAQEYLGDKTEARVYDDFQNDIWLQYQQKEMQVGDTANLRPWRLEQIITNAIANDVARPMFHYELISGDSISLDTESSDSKAVVTAEKPGTSVVKVTYDALDYKEKHWDPISAVNTAYAIYTVGETGSAEITCSDNLKNWRHYDTVYYNEGETVPFDFAVDAPDAKSVKVTLNGLEIDGTGNAYTANLENRSNIIGVEATDSEGNIKSLYRVVDARFIEVQVANKENPDQPLKAGDTANISFKGITMPVYKLATIYNPQFGKNATRVEYSNDILGDFQGKCGQWDLATKNSFDVVFEEEGRYTFNSKGIYCTWWGSELGADVVAEGSGEPNLNAPTLADYFSKLPDFTVEVAGETSTEEYLGDKTEARVYDDFQNDIWLQYQQKEMKAGDTANLRPWRLEQAVTDVINNDVARPTFHFEIIAGDSISLDTTASNDKAIVTAEKPGTSVVKVTYDALDYKEKHWDPISAVNTAYAIYTVGETGSAEINCSDNLKNWRHYDTVYYNEGETVPFDFTVDAPDAKSVKVTLNGLEIDGTGNAYTANLENRSNIIGVEATDSEGNVKSLYRVVDARFIEVQVANKDNPDQPLKAGDTANISFKGITMPVYKLATIYNPQFGKNATRVEYSNDILGDFQGKCGQWDLATKNSFDVVFEEEGSYTFNSKGIYCTWWGSELGADVTAEGSGEPNLNAPTLADYFSTLPEFTVDVESSVAVKTVTMNKENLELNLGQEEQLSAEVKPDNATHKTITWSSSDKDVVSVSSSGMVTAIKAGTAIISAEADGVKAECSVLVKGASIDEVSSAIAEIPEGNALTLRDKAAIESARQLYDSLKAEDQVKVENYSKLEAAETKIKELMKTPFMFSLNGQILNAENTGEETGYRGYYYKVEIPAGTKTVQLERYKDITVQNKNYTTLIPAGTETADITDVKLGKDNYLILNYDKYYYDYIYFEEGKLGAEITTDTVYPGTEVTVSLKNLSAPKTGLPVHSMQTIFKTDIPGVEQVKSKEAAVDESQLSAVTFTVPEDTKPGTYHLTEGHVFKEWGGIQAQGIFWVGKETGEFYKGEIPDLVLEVKDAQVQGVIDVIDNLGEITSLDQEESVIAARTAYEELTDEQKVMVTNLDKLIAAEEMIVSLNPTPSEGDTVTIDVERFSIGQGFYREPVKVKLDGKQSVMDLLITLEGDNLVLNQDGTYLSGIRGADLGTGVVVPDYISEVLGGPTTADANEIGNDDDVLGEFDYGSGSGWYYLVNNIAPNKGAAAYYPQDGDVIRLAFTMCWGSDLTGQEIGSEESLLDISNMDEALKLLAEINSGDRKEELLANAEVKTAYESVMKIVQNAIAAKSDVDAAVLQLKEAVKNVPVDPEEKPIGNVTVTIQDVIATPAGEEWSEPKGIILDHIQVPVYQKDSMMDAIERACTDNQIEFQKGVGNASIQSIDGLKEFGRGSNSSWMTTLNNSFTREGLNTYTVENGKLMAGDTLTVEYTLQSGNDLTDISDKTGELKDLGISGGVLTPEFEKSTYEYKLVLDQNTEQITLKPVSFNRFNEIQIIVGEKEYRSNAAIPAVLGNKIEIKSTAGTVLRAANGQTYTLTMTNKAIMNAEKMIADLPGTEALTLNDKAIVQAARDAFNALSKEEQGVVSNLSVLEAAEARIKEIEKLTEEEKAEIENVIMLINKIGETVTLDSEVNIKAARDAYNALTNEQKKLVTNYVKLETAEKALEDLKNEKPDPKPDPEPDPETVTITNSEYGISITGKKLTSEMELRASRLDTNGEAVKALRGEIPSNQGLFALYNISLVKDGKEISLPEKSVLKIPVGAKYNDKTMNVLLYADGKVEKFSGKVEDSFISVEVTKLGAFGVITSVENNGSQNDDKTTGNTASGTTGSGSKTVKTGDVLPADRWMTLMLLIAGMAVITGSITWKKSRK